ncbi:DUF294 nucleotidyltransferase-like domain-containing protein [Corynebacterium ulceribovis]|uniref:DUF294 nucleotidyltransferase-like domain-containing protein n=1 Tax=Corynebacterium ulceribovis TaxID=487732 RepID=UPI0003702D19|nr:DUF294 nucleotidyltransferase-like domain-containing protein [Corynebacterium ulceribovis]
MTVELDEVRNFLADTEPFAHLPAEELDRLPAQLTMRYIRRGEQIIEFGAENDTMYIIRSGAVDLTDEQGVLLDRREPGRSFAYSTLMGDPVSQYGMVAVEDSLVLQLHQTVFTELATKYSDFKRYYSSLSIRMQSVAEQLHQATASEVLQTTLAEFKIPNPATVTPHTTIVDAARMMSDRNVSSLLIGTDDRLDGIITDRDLRSKVVAEGLDINLPVSDIMTTKVATQTSDALAFESMLLMAELSIHHVPVVDEGKVTGIISSADIMRLLRYNPIYMTADLSRRTTPKELKQTFDFARDVAIRFVERGATSDDVGRLMTVAADALARRLLTLAEEALGPPPVPYCFVVIGSQGRRGVGLASDQDNCLVLSDDYDHAAHGNYFAQLSTRVCEGLDAAGQVLCPGDMMAMNPKWRMTETQWKNTFHNWINAPDPDALLHAQTFFDFRGIHGDTSLAERVHSHVVRLAQAPTASRMHAHLAALAVRREPPLGFFRGLVVDRAGEYAHTLDVKKGGIAAIVQIARLYGLMAGVDSVRTTTRLQLAAQAGVLQEKEAADLIASFSFLSLIALRNQSHEIMAGEQPTYNIDPKKLAKLDREHLRDAFQIIKNTQNGLATKFPIRNI